jgi:hypothetical protein
MMLSDMPYLKNQDNEILIQEKKRRNIHRSNKFVIRVELVDVESV